MKNQYSDSAEAAAAPLTLAFDTGSPVTSVALGRGERVLAARAAEGGRSSARLLALIGDALEVAGVERSELERVVAARGPGSFTGLRVGLATALGLQQALAVPATALGSLPALARAVAAPGDARPVVALIDALRGEWYAQPYAGGSAGGALAEPRIVTPEVLLRHAPCRLTGFGLDRLPASLAGEEGVEVVPALPLAPTLLALAADPDLDWDPAPLVEPLYLRPPAASA